MTDSRRDQLAAALGTELRATIGRPPNPLMVDGLTDAVLPLVDRMCADAAAEALNEAASDFGDYADEAIEVALGGAQYVADVLRARASALTDHGDHQPEGLT